MDCVLRTMGLTKRYKKHMAVNGADMTINKGDIYGFVGENGSGKTTIIRMITGLIFPDSGSFELFGLSNTDPKIGTARRRLGAVVETPSIYRNLSAYDNLKMQCGILGVGDDTTIRQALRDVGLEELYSDKKQAGNFSLGMRQRLGIAMALLGEPEFLLLDEPMNGLDPAGIVEVRELILKLNREKGITFLISSHILTELSLVATKYGIISKGKIIQEITDQELHQACSMKTEIKVDRPELLPQVLGQEVPEDALLPMAGGAIIVGNIDLNVVFYKLIQAGVRILSVNCLESSFEDYYLSLIGGGSHG